MGNREALRLGAKRCLLEKGYARTTSRDIAAVSKVSLAAIGYHFGSKEALLTEALILAFGDWDREFHETLSASIPPNTTGAERFELIWARLIKTFETHRSLWVANFELFSEMDRQPVIRQILGNSIQLARAGLAALFRGEDESAICERTVQTVGTFHHVLLTGMIAQWLIDPKRSLSAGDLTESLLTIATGLQARNTTLPSKRRSPGSVQNKAAAKGKRSRKRNTRVRAS
jgi:AcrR family transcriptional regulator